MNGPSTPLLAATLRPGPQDIDRLALKALASRKAPGFSLAITFRGGPYYAQGYGVSDVVSGTPATAASRHAIGSISKQFAAVSVLQLMEGGKLRLDDTLAQYYPAFRNARLITLRMLLHQISGLHNYPDTREHPWPRRGTIPAASLLPFFASDQPDFTPGLRFGYANTNYFALAAVVEKVTERSYCDYLRDNLLTPLGMHQSGAGFADQAGIAPAYGGPKVPAPLSLDLFQGRGRRHLKRSRSYLVERGATTRHASSARLHASALDAGNTAPGGKQLRHGFCGGLNRWAS